MMVSEKPLITKFRFKNIFIFYFSLLVRYLSSALNNRTSELKHGRVPFVGSCRSFIFVYIPGVSLPDARALGQHRINAKNRIIQWVPNKNCE